jgi:4-amino-4-deoxy-L-arabinose transferase-like glycosyltransferase
MAGMRCQERIVVIDTILQMMNDPVQQWLVYAVFLVVFGPLLFLVVRFLWSLPKAQKRTLAKIVLTVIFFPLIFLFLAVTADSDD